MWSASWLAFISALIPDGILAPSELIWCWRPVAKLLLYGHIDINNIKSPPRLTCWWPSMDANICHIVKDIRGYLRKHNSMPSQWTRGRYPTNLAARSSGMKWTILEQIICFGDHWFLLEVVRGVFHRVVSCEDHYWGSYSARNWHLLFYGRTMEFILLREC